MTLLTPHKPAAHESTAWRAAALSSGAAMLCCDPLIDRVMDCNPALEALLGSERSALMAQPMSALFADDLPRLISLTQACLDKGRYYSGEISLRTAQQGSLPVEIHASAFVENERQLLLLLIFDASEVQARREQTELHWLHRGGLLEWKRIEGAFREVERNNQLILSAAGEGIYGVNAEGATTFVNPAALKMLGWEAGELIGRDAHTVFHHTHQDGTPYPSHCCPIYAAFNDGIVHVVDDEVFWRKDGSVFPVEYTSTPIRDEGTLVGAVVVFRDVSERRDAERRLRLALAEVETLKERLEMENAYLQEEIRAEHDYRQIVGRSQPIKHCIRQIKLVAPTDAPVLITGESGTGKELIARAIHESSPRSQRPLIRVNCAAIPRELFESEFFGHIRGAFTGATADRPGRFELADGGTIFLDEVGELPLDLQGKLLRVLQDQQFERVGDTRTRTVDVRIIAATNRQLRQEVEQRQFREDLYFRLNVFPIESAPLRQRTEDIPLLATHLIAQACKKLKKPELALSLADLEKLQSYHWPGNIRELENIIERAVILSAAGRLHIELPSRPAQASGALSDGFAAKRAGAGSSTPEGLVMTEQERRLSERENIINALRQTGGKVSGADGAAALLGIKPPSLYSRLRRWHIDRRAFSQARPY
ncbi:sigma 54-interacting transcriptional regulator [Halopseudomonas sp.]|uniref:sigma 54-interacting transcriptional regulator n=1 Tax=Halopseudomonas sp. TaxID=2901191 RepID=UPI0030030EB7